MYSLYLTRVGLAQWMPIMHCRSLCQHLKGNMQAISFKACVGGASSQLGVGTAKARAPAAASAIVCKSRSTYQACYPAGFVVPAA
jgi:hypothetical protein